MSQCYAPNAVPVSQLGPCNPSESISLCCTPGQICLTNGLCATGERQFYSGACTDKTYKASICPSFCMGTNKFVVECHDSIIPDGGFCCDATGVGTCCGSLDNKLDLAPSVSSAVAANQADISSPKSVRSSSLYSSDGQTTSSMSASNVPSASSVSSETTTASVVTSVWSDIASDGTSIHTVLSTITSTLVPVSTTTGQANHTASDGSGGHSGRNISLAVSLPLGVIIVIIFSILFYKFLTTGLDWLIPRRTRHPTAGTTAFEQPDANKSESNVHELHDMPAATPELGSSSVPRQDTIHELPASTVVSNPPPYYPLHRQATTYPGHSPISVTAPSSVRSATSVAHMDGTTTPPVHIVHRGEIPRLSNSPPPPYQANDESTPLPRSNEGGPTLPGNAPAQGNRAGEVMRIMRLRGWGYWL